MTDPTHLLTLIETAEPSDVARLDELDGRVSCYLRNIDPDMMMQSVIPYPMWKDSSNLLNRYTRSRDALKAIRPKRWICHMICSGDGAAFEMKHERDSGDNTQWRFTVEAKTEELAELHAIIQAIAHDRAGEDTHGLHS